MVQFSSFSSVGLVEGVEREGVEREGVEREGVRDFNVLTRLASICFNVKARLVILKKSAGMD
jgi:hypothetical protein